MIISKQKISLSTAIASVMLFSVMCFMVCPLIEGYADAKSESMISYMLKNGNKANILISLPIQDIKYVKTSDL